METIDQSMDYIVKALVDYGEQADSLYVKEAVKFILSQTQKWSAFDASAVQVSRIEEP